MKIAIIAPPVNTIPPERQGGLEIILAYKIEALVKMGHEVHLFGAGENNISGISYNKIFPKSLSEIAIDPVNMEASRKLRLETSYMINVLEKIINDQQNFDCIFNHTRATELLPLLIFDKIRTPIFNIFHLPILSEHIDVIKKFPNSLFISISDDQRADYPGVKNFVGTVHNGIDPDKYPFSKDTDEFILWVGTIGAHKNPLEAIKVAQAINSKIILMGKIRDQDYFEENIKDHIDNKIVKYLGEINYTDKLPYFQKAKVAIFPTKIREACPVTPIELTMCGTPVVAYPSGGTKEIIENGINGFLVDNFESLIEKTKEAYELNRQTCHEFTKNNFSSEVMAKKYLEIVDNFNTNGIKK
ncbi:MAG: glycosyl transferase [Candidatus Berkelbacteria bacterium]|nr:glycosyl transferase [Candidatus Berkelbacteria bacterium]